MTPQFSDKQRDRESNLDYFGARYNASRLGRFIPPDPGNIGVNELMGSCLCSPQLGFGLAEDVG